MSIQMPPKEEVSKHKDNEPYNFKGNKFINLDGKAHVYFGDPPADQKGIGDAEQEKS